METQSKKQGNNFDSFISLIEGVYMNNITIIGTIQGAATLSILKKETSEKPMINFKLVDKGDPYQRPKESVIFNVYFSKDSAAHISHYITNNKELAVIGCIQKKKYGEEYVYAEKILFTGKAPKKGTEYV